MSNTVLQIKRSTTNAAPASLSNGELAYAGLASSNSLFIGHPDGSTGVIRIAGGKYSYLHQSSNTPGTVVGNAVVITDTNAFVSNTYTRGLGIVGSGAFAANTTTAHITSISPEGSAANLGASSTGSNNELVTSWAIKTYVDNKAAAGGINSAAQYTFSNVVTFNSNVAIAGNATSTLYVGSVGAAGNGVVLSNSSVTVGNSTVNSVTNSTAFSGTANNASNLGGISLTTVQAQITGNAATAYSNATSYADTKAGTAYSNAVANAAALYQTTAGLSANVLTLAANAATYLGNSSGTIGNITSYITGNAATAYTNATVFAANGANINSGTVSAARLGSGTANSTTILYGNSVWAAPPIGVNTDYAYTFSNVITFNSNVSLIGNSSSVLTIGSAGAAGNGVVVSNSTIIIGNTTVNSTINATSFTGTANNSTNLGGSSLATVQAQITGNAATAYSNAVSNAAALYQTTAGLSANVATLSANAATYLGNSSGTIGNITAYITGNAATAYTNATTYSSNASNLSGGTVDNARLPSSINVTSVQAGNATSYGITNSTSIAFTVPTGAVAITGTAISVGNTTQNTSISFGDIAATGNISAGNLTLSGNLVVRGSLTSVNTTNLIVKDNFIQMADQNDLAITDTVDFGWYGVANSGGVKTYYGSGRVAASNTIAFFSTTADPSANNNLLGALTAMPVSAGSLTLTTALAATSGGTGKSSYTAGDILYASNTTYLTALSSGTDGQVLQVVGTTLTWGGIDGGSF